MKEEWKVISGFPDYAVSSLGRVKRLTPACGTWVGRILSPASSKGYAHVSLRRGNESATTRVHVLVCTAFHGPCPSPEHEAAHNNGVRKDNRKENLRWATAADNQVDRVAHGTDIRGSAVFGAVLREAEVSDTLKGGVVQRRLAETYGVSPSTIHLINIGKIWRHVT